MIIEALTLLKPSSGSAHRTRAQGTSWPRQASTVDRVHGALERLQTVLRFMIGIFIHRSHQPIYAPPGGSGFCPFVTAELPVPSLWEVRAFCVRRGLCADAGGDGVFPIDNQSRDPTRSHENLYASARYRLNHVKGLLFSVLYKFWHWARLQRETDHENENVDHCRGRACDEQHGIRSDGCRQIDGHRRFDGR